MSFVGKSSQGISGFSPTSIPDCALWLDAADSSSLTLSGSNMSGWRDKSGTGRTVTFSNTVTYTSATPSVNTSIANSSRIVVDLDLRKSVVNNANIFIVYAWSGFSLAGSSNQFLWGQDMGGGWNRLQFLSYPAATSFAYNLGYRLTGGPPYSVPVSNMATSNRLIYHATYSYLTANATGVYINGTLSSTLVTEGPASPETTSTSTVFGTLNLDSNAPFANIEFNEIIVFSNAITVAQRQQIEGYLARKWNLTSSLPATQPFKSLPPFSRPFQPTDISGCAVWLDAMDTTALDLSGTGVRQWLDKSGRGRNAVAGGRLPTVGTTVTTGLRCIDFVATNSNYFLLQDASTLSPTSATYFVQAYASSLTGSLMSFWANSRILGSNYYWNMVTNFGFSPYTWLSSNAVLTIVENSASNCTVYWNGNFVGSQAYQPRTNAGYAASAVNQVVIGGHWSLSPYWTGNIQEVILYDGALTSGQRQQVETYLTNKWSTRGFTPSNHSARLAPALSLSFVPTSVDSCLLWLDAADSTSVTITSGAVSQWTDKTGNGYSFSQTTAGNRPTVSSNAINGLNAISFVGSAGTGVATQRFDNASIPISNAGYSIFAVARGGSSQPSSTGYNYILKGNLSSDFYLFFGNHSSKNFATFTGTSGGWNDINSNSPAVSTTNTTLLMGMTVSNTVLAPYYNGNAMTTKTGTTGSFTSMRIGDTTPDNYTGQNWNGLIAEILIYNITLTPQQRQLVEGYLANKWGLANSLPNGHPFKTVKP